MRGSEGTDCGWGGGEGNLHSHMHSNKLDNGIRLGVFISRVGTGPTTQLAAGLQVTHVQPGRRDLQMLLPDSMVVEARPSKCTL
jgi:hypothetical protein